MSPEAWAGTTAMWLCCQGVNGDLWVPTLDAHEGRHGEVFEVRAHRSAAAAAEPGADRAAILGNHLADIWARVVSAIAQAPRQDRRAVAQGQHVAFL